MRRPGAGLGVGVVAARARPGVERTRVDAAEAQSAAGVQRDHEGSEITVVVRSPVARRRLNDS